jgi:hypothetical protein
MIAAKPTPLSASATPGSQMTRTTSRNADRTADVGSIGRSGAITPSVANGSSSVASAIAANPELAYNPVPSGAPTANAV